MVYSVTAAVPKGIFAMPRPFEHIASGTALMPILAKDVLYVSKG